MDISSCGNLESVNINGCSSLNTFDCLYNSQLASLDIGGCDRLISAVETGSVSYNSYSKEYICANVRLRVDPSIQLLIDSVPVVSVNSISLDQSALSLTVGSDTAVLTATLLPENATNRNVSWTSSNNYVATVSDIGVVTPVGEGTAIIYVETNDGRKVASCIVEVAPSPYSPGWNEIDGNYYYADENGILVHGWLLLSGKQYYLDPETGVMQIGWKEIEGNWYYFKTNGSMITGWKILSGNTYYFDENGVMLTGWQTIKNRNGDPYKYYFDADGVMQTGWQTIKNAKGVEYKYYFGSNGAMRTGWQWIANSKGVKYRYYFHTNGVMLTGWRTIKNAKGVAYKYYFHTNGVMLTGWQTIGGKKHYFHTNGVMLTGFQKIKAANGKTYFYYFNPKIGVMLTGWQTIKNAKGVAYKYYFHTNGVMLTGLQKIKAANGKTYIYYFGTNGAMVTNKSVKISGKTYTFNKNGICTKIK